MIYKVVYTKQTEKFLNKLPDAIYIRISKKIKELSQNPYSTFLDIKKLVGGNDEFRLRVGDYRILYKVENGDLIIFIVSIGHRKDVYE
jgi:mRNA interferase RelE/StbE